MRAIFLLRHAKSGSDPKLADHDRPLARRGEKASRKLAVHLAEAGIRPALVLCSTAVRTRQTLEGVKTSLGDDVDVWLDDALYGAGARELLERLRQLPPAVPSVMVIGHNPGLHDLALELVGGGDKDAVARLNEKFPTGALATLLVPDRWKTLTRGSATLDALVVPRELPAP